MLNEYESKTKNEFSREAQLGELTPTKSHFIGKEVESQIGPPQNEALWEKEQQRNGSEPVACDGGTEAELAVTRRHSQAVRQGSATPVSPVRFWLSP